MVNGFRLISSIVRGCGSRPTALGILRLYVQVLASALVAGGLEEADLDEMLAAVLGAGAAAKAAGILASACLEGMGGAFLMFRIAALTEDRIFGDVAGGSAGRGYARALSMMRQTSFVSDLARQMGRSAAGVAGKAADALARRVGVARGRDELCRK